MLKLSFLLLSSDWHVNTQKEIWMLMVGIPWESLGLPWSSNWGGTNWWMPPCYVGGIPDFPGQLVFFSFSRLTKATHCTNELVWRNSRCSSTIRPSPMIWSTLRKRLMVVTFEKGKGVKCSSSKKPTYSRRKPSKFPVLPPFPCGAKKAAVLLE